ncbi:MAG: tetratricopeptide repeat protein [Limnohabitans sp.]|nr:tetratricopeptide repeat protein [Limnohabitans sp.]
MNINEITYLINNPNTINPNQVLEMEKILTEFPYFQSIRNIYTKGLQKQDSFKYNSALKKSAAYTTDRSILFDFITNEHFFEEKKKNAEVQKSNIENTKDNSEVLNNSIESVKTEIELVTSSEENTNTLLETEPIVETEIEVKKTTEEKFESALERSILQSIKEALPEELEVTDNELMEMKAKISWLEDKIETDEEVKPVSFTKNETHSFQEWLQLAKTKPIEREIDENTKNNSISENNINTNEDSKSETKLDSKIDLIDKFISTNPKIPSPKENLPIPSYLTKKEDTPYLMTETLAKIYLEQKKYSKAIQAYEILILKYPEKSSLFADRILDIKDLQQNNNK